MGYEAAFPGVLFRRGIGDDVGDAHVGLLSGLM